jgi:hypothetical protein
MPLYMHHAQSSPRVCIPSPHSLATGRGRVGPGSGTRPALDVGLVRRAPFGYSGPAGAVGAGAAGAQPWPAAAGHLYKRRATRCSESLIRRWAGAAAQHPVPSSNRDRPQSAHKRSPRLVTFPAKSSQCSSCQQRAALFRVSAVTIQRLVATAGPRRHADLPCPGQ